MALTEFSAALKQVATERGIPVESVIESIRTALLAAYKRDYEVSETEEVVVTMDSETGEAKIVKDGKDVTPSGFGRIAAQTAKQVILQKIRETEKEVITDEFRSKVGTLINAHVFRVEHNLVTVDLGKAHAVMPQSEQVASEIYRQNQRLKVYVKDVRDGSRGTEVIVSRADPQLVAKLFEQEVPEIAAGTVKIEAIAREAGSRTKMAVSSSDDKIDPVGSCVGQKGVRVQSIITELFGEKIDIVPYSAIPEKFVAASLSPAKVTDVELDEENKKAVVSVPEDQQSLAIGKDGQNARLANRLTHWKIDIKGVTGLFGNDSSDEVHETEKTKNKSVVGIWDVAIKASKDEHTAKVDLAKAEAVAEELKASETPIDEEMVTNEEPTAEATAEVQE